jgi:hypothetical protein
VAKVIHLIVALPYWTCQLIGNGVDDCLFAQFPDGRPTGLGGRGRWSLLGRPGGSISTRVYSGAVPGPGRRLLGRWHVI